MMVSEPMSDERLAEIRAMLDGFQYGTLTITSVTPEQAVEAYNAHHGARWAISDLLAEVERLRAREAVLLVHQRATQEDIIEGRAREAALVAVVERVAEAGVGDDSSGGTWLMFSGYDAETVREQARALLAATEPTDATTAE